MTSQYRWVAWNAHKKAYDLIAGGLLAAYLIAFVGGTFLFARPAAPSDMFVVLMRAFGTAAIVMLHIVLCIGPAARLTSLAAPLLYNRRHLGVMTFGVALIHAALVALWYLAFGDKDPISALVDGRSLLSIAAFPFELLGVGALIILFLMAATSHDFWLHQLSPRVWKALHMSVYVAYALVVLHAVLGIMRSEQSPIYTGLIVLGVLTVGGLHAWTGIRELVSDETGTPAPASDHADRWIKVCEVDEIPEDRAKVVCLAQRERVAVFRNGATLSAISNVCAHQGGPLGEGKIVDGCVTCPWHGYQYNAENGQSPPPFTEKIPTYRVRIEGRDVLLDPRALPPGTPVEPTVIGAQPDDTELFESVDASSDLDSTTTGPNQSGGDA